MGDNGPDQQLLRQVHPRVRRHLEAAHFQEAQPTGGAVGGIELVDADLAAVGVARHVGQQVAQEPVHQPGGRRVPLPAQVRRGGHVVERDVQLVEGVVPRLVHPRCLAGGADEQTREQIGQGRVPLPVEQQALQHVRPPQEGGIRRIGRPHHHMRPAAGARVAAVDHELVGPQAAGAGVLIDAGGDGHRLVPAGGGMDVHLDHAGVRGHLQHRHPVIVGRGVALQPDRQAIGGHLDLGHQLEIVLRRGDGGHEHIEPVLPHLHRQGGADDGGLGRPAGAHRLRLRGRGPGMDGTEVGQGAAILEGIGIDDVGIVVGRHGRQAAQRQAQTHG